MRTLSSLFQEPQAIAAPIVARDLFAIWREQQTGLSNPCNVQWVDKLGAEKVNVDAGLMATVFRELLNNAATFSQGGAISATAWRDGDQVVFELREPKTEALDPSDWGQAFSTTRRNGYGLGLWSARRLAEATGATIDRHHILEEKALITRITVPVA
jgi:signal transduction histidine kinase